MTESSSRHLAKLAAVDDIGCSAFVAFAYLSHAERLSPELARSIRYDRAAVYDWYLTVYAPAQLPDRAPLSDNDIAWLMEDVALEGVAFAAPRVVTWAALKPFSEGGRHLANGDKAALLAWWSGVCAEIGMENRLVPSGLPSAAADMAAPAIATYAADVEVAAPISRASGLARAAKASIAAFEAAGLKVKATDISHGQSAADPDYVAPPVVQGRTPATVFHVNPDALPYAFARAHEAFAPRRAGIFVWELDHPATSDFLGLDLVDEIWAASRFVQGVYQPVFDGVVAHVPPTVPAPDPVDMPAARTELRRRAGVSAATIVFMAMVDGLSYLARKNPLATIDAFRQAFPDRTDVALVLKVHHRTRQVQGGEADIWRGIDEAARADPRIRIIEATLPYGEVMRLVAGADAYVSLHRSEGFGLGPAEAMMRGVPAIVTAYGGTEDYCSDGAALRVPYRLVPVPWGGYLNAESGRLWADADVTAAAAHMRLLAGDAALRRTLGDAGRERTLKQLSLAAVAPGYAANFERLVAGAR
jgi:glycosyltransferase involved in cell wall biosynthesis